MSNQKKRVHMVIHGASVSASGIAVGLAQIPFADVPPLTFLQGAMVTEIARIHGVGITQSAAGKLIGVLSTRTVGVVIARQLVGWLPLYGNAIKAGTAFSLTEALGWAADRYFKREKETPTEPIYEHVVPEVANCGRADKHDNEAASKLALFILALLILAMCERAEREQSTEDNG